LAADSSLRDAPAIDWPTIAGCWALNGLGLFGLPGVHIPGAWRYAWWVMCLGAGVCLLARARHWRLPALGLVLRIEPSVAFWLRVSAWMTGVVALGFAIAILFTRAGADPFGFCGPGTPVSAHEVYGSVIRAPIVEEIAFRLLLCGPLVGRLSTPANVAVNGLTFALVHVVAGGIGPDSVLGGFLLAWAFLRSGTLAVPLLMHAVGNAALVAFAGSGLLAALACPGG
jgi:membrane protease YdiL (CAAX protease family)